MKPHLPEATAQRLPCPYRCESVVAQALHASLEGVLSWPAVVQAARPWVIAVRNNPPPFWAMESLLREYPIASSEGLALMRLAEALLRIPDVDTAIALTADQLGRADFDGRADGLVARLSGSAMALSKYFLPHPADAAAVEQGLLGRLGARTVVAATLRAVQLLGRQFVLGQTIAAAMGEARAARRKPNGPRFSYDMLGEGARTQADALKYLAAYEHAITSIAATAVANVPVNINDGISIKLSALHPRYEDAQLARVMSELVPRVWGLCDLAARANISLTIDAEEVERLELSLDVFEALAAHVARHHPQWEGFGLALQAYQTRSLDLVHHVIAMARKYGLRFMCRLVKGAYWDSEIKRAQELGLPHYPVFTHKHHTDIAYLACAKALLESPDAIYPQFAGHNAATIAAVIQLAGRTTAAFELQRLHGMGEGVFREVLRNPHIRCCVYAPVGSHRDLLAYLVRRLLENGANSSFVHQLADESVGMDELLLSPLSVNPVPLLALPPELYGAGRRNSAGVDLTVESMRAPLRDALATVAIPAVPLFDVTRLPQVMRTVTAGHEAWRKLPVEERADVLRRAADTMEGQMPVFCALLVAEAFKTWGDAVSEVREAVDFLRYYANDAERIMQPLALPGPTGETNEWRLVPRGVWVCISPWNFPLAIFTGQVAAALVSGNAVLAKPAEQTPGIASAAVELLHRAGVLQDALQLLHGPGETVGAALVSAAGIAGVVFTGSTAVAKSINRALAVKEGPIVPLIAETGGINAMLVDSSALPEQVVDAVMQSAFRSAGQRCSALRLLCVHEGLAERTIEMIRGAMQELATGDPASLATDVGPLIDREAYEAVAGHVERLGVTWGSGPTPDGWQRPHLSNLFAPAIFEVAALSAVDAEIFGPVLQVVRWGSGSLTTAEGLIDAINALGYGLTLGIQTRIDSRARTLAARARVGNTYINRNMTGAVVGVQPFGGEGLSGTGPKAGGPQYLYRFCSERTVTVNTTAAGGNVQLMA